MSNTRKDQQRKEEEASTTKTTTASFPSQTQHQEEQRQSLNKSIDETRDHVRKTLDEARKDIPRYTQAANQYQEQTIQTAREIADNFLESQKEIINSFQSAWVPVIERTYGIFWNYWLSPRYFTQLYANMVSNFANSWVAAARLANNAVFANMQALRTTMQQTRDNAKELSKISVNAARSLEQTTRDTTNSYARSSA